MQENREGLEAAEMLTKAIASLDKDVFAQVYADDAVIWHAATDQTQTKEENVGFLAMIFDMVSEMGYADIRRHSTPEGFVQDHRLTGKFKDGTPIPSLHACLICKVENGKITELREFFDPKQFQEVWDRLGIAIG